MKFGEIHDHQNDLLLNQLRLDTAAGDGTLGMCPAVTHIHNMVLNSSS